MLLLVFIIIYYIQVKCNNTFVFINTYKLFQNQQSYGQQQYERVFMIKSKLGVLLVKKLQQCQLVWFYSLANTPDNNKYFKVTKGSLKQTV